MRIIDLFCGAGGAAYGYHMAFPHAEIIGVDIEPQPNYPFTFVQADAVTHPLDGADFVHASPPCQGYTALAVVRDSSHYPRLIPAIRDKLTAHGSPWVIENVPGSPLQSPTCLCGSSFQLPIRRHRLFESSFPIRPVPCLHDWQNGDWTPLLPRGITRKTVPGAKQSIIPIYGKNERYVVGLFKWAMGVHWMQTCREVTESIPPLYTAYIGRNLK